MIPSLNAIPGNFGTATTKLLDPARTGQPSVVTGRENVA
jgi:hypothetical protein